MKKVIILVIVVFFALLVTIIYFLRDNEDIKIMNTNTNYEDVKGIPNSYYGNANESGTLEEFYYDTYESTTYDEKSKPLRKRAIVYLPYGYDENKKYDILYLMHGGWSDETTSLGTLDNSGVFKNVIDNAIQNGEIRPIIIVCPTYNNESNEDSADYTLAYYTLTVNYHNELANDLIPAVESKYSTYADGTSHEDIVASRNHRAFGGFSMGSVTTWHTFVNCLDSFQYFITSSGAIDDDLIDSSVSKQGYTKDDFFITAFTGTEDFAYSGFNDLINRLLNKESGNFVSGTNEENGNLYFRIKEGYSHDGTAFMTYMYNGLLKFYYK